MNNPPTAPERSDLPPADECSYRILVVDDNRAIHDDFCKILGGKSRDATKLNALEQTLFGAPAKSVEGPFFELHSAYQGQEALTMVEKACEQNAPYALAFVDIRMPPGWDGIETLGKIWHCCPEIQAVICTAYSDYSWEEITRSLAHGDSLLILKKPFDTVEVLQIAHALTKKWALGKQARLRMDELDYMAQERTQALRKEVADRLKLEAQLRQSQKMEAIGCLAAGIAHEFNNLLTVIQGHAGLLRTKPADSRSAADSIERISQASFQAASLTRRLLAFSRKQSLQLKPLHLSAAVQNMQRMLARLIGEKYEIDLRCEPDLPPVLADEASIQQALINLVLNARDAMPEGGRIRVSVNLVALDEDAARDIVEAQAGQYLCLSVTDSGCGMTEDILERIFDPFFTTKEVGKGTGLGLSTAHGIIQQHEGWIQVASEPGRGSTFKIFMRVAENVTVASPTPHKSFGATHLCRGDGEAVLIVEDEATVREMARMALEQGGYRVIEAADGPAALELWKKSPVPIDVLVTDMVMPNGMSGAGLARELLARDSQLRIVYTSGYNSDVLKEDRGVLRGDNFLPKPYDPLSLLKTVKHCLASSPEELVPS